MVDRQLRRRGIRDQRVLAPWPPCRASGSCRRRSPTAPTATAPWRSGTGQTISQPWIVARMSELLALEGPERVLEVGTGSGYGAAVLSHICARTWSPSSGCPRLSAAAGRALRRAGHPQRRAAHRRRLAPACPTARPFDAICVTASAAGAEPPPRWWTSWPRRRPGVPAGPRRRGAPGRDARRRARERRPRALRAAGRGRRVKREHSAGGVVLRGPADRTARWPTSSRGGA